MTAGDREIKERSVDSLQQIYAVVIALAISQAVEGLLKEPTGGMVYSYAQVQSGLPAVVAFLFTLVPFWHGMNRHLDRCYLEKKTGVVEGALLLDFGVFLVEAGLLFAVSWSLRSGLGSFYCLGALLGIDMVWGGISHFIHFRGQKSHVARWAKVNCVAIGTAIAIIALPTPSRLWLLMVVAVLRTVADYGFCWRFYFPRV